jgi:transposase InsO family protein
MRQESLHGAMPPARRERTTDSNHRHRIAENLLDRRNAGQFTATGVNQKWVSDITYIGTDEGWLYLATVMDLFSRRIVGWSMSQQIDQQLTLSALGMALQQRGQAIAAGTTLLHHSDRGSQYAAASYQQLLGDWGIIVSMSRKGNCWDNVVIESWHRTLKVELVWSQEYHMRNQARTSAFEYIEVFYNQRHRHSSLGYLTPAEFERRHVLLS